MKRTISLLLLLTAVMMLAACSSSEPAPEVAEGLTVTNVRANMTLPSDTGSFWMEIANNSNTDDALVGAEVEGCGVIELHDMIMENDVMIMREVEGGEIPIPAGETVELKRGGLHVMCINKEAPLEAGTTVDMALQFADAGTIAVVAEVVAPGEMEMDMNHEAMPEGEMDHSNESMDHSESEMGMEMEMEMGAMPTPRSPEDLKGGLFVSLTRDDLDRAAMAINFATKVRNETGKPATIFLNVEGVRLVDKAIPQNVHVSGKTVHEMLQAFMDAGGVVLVCPMCMKNVGGLDQSDLIDGVIIGSPDYTWSAMFAEDVTVVNY